MSAKPRIFFGQGLPARNLLVLSALRTVLSCSLALSFFFGQLDLPLQASSLPSTNKKKNAAPTLQGLPITELSADEAVYHALNRLAYGPRPGDVDRIKQVGLAKWIDQQLNTRSIKHARTAARPT